MPKDTGLAVKWALQQKDAHGNVITSSELVDYVRIYFNENNIEYETFSYEDLKPYL